MFEFRGETTERFDLLGDVRHQTPTTTGRVRLGIEFKNLTVIETRRSSISSNGDSTPSPDRSRRAWDRGVLPTVLITPPPLGRPDPHD